MATLLLLTLTFVSFELMLTLTTLSLILLDRNDEVDRGDDDDDLEDITSKDVEDGNDDNVLVRLCCDISIVVMDTTDGSVTVAVVVGCAVAVVRCATGVAGVAASCCSFVRSTHVVANIHNAPKLSSSFVLTMVPGTGVPGVVVATAAVAGGAAALALWLRSSIIGDDVNEMLLL